MQLFFTANQLSPLTMMHNDGDLQN